MKIKTEKSKHVYNIVIIYMYDEVYGLMLSTANFYFSNWKFIFFLNLIEIEFDFMTIIKKLDLLLY